MSVGRAPHPTGPQGLVVNGSGPGPCPPVRAERGPTDATRRDQLSRPWGTRGPLGGGLDSRATAKVRLLEGLGRTVDRRASAWRVPRGTLGPRPLVTALGLEVFASPLITVSGPEVSALGKVVGVTLSVAISAQERRVGRARSTLPFLPASWPRTALEECRPRRLVALGAEEARGPGGPLRAPEVTHLCLRVGLEEVLGRATPSERVPSVGLKAATGALPRPPVMKEAP